MKRKKVNYTEDPNATQWPYGSWVEEEPIYYIRSTVLGGQVISETTGTGAKKKTYVLAAGAKIATQSEYTYNSSTTESVTFDHFDVSGMSYRSSMSGGTVNTADGQYEGAPAEMDPMGGNFLILVETSHPPGVILREQVRSPWYGASNNLSYTYQNNRVTNSGWQYDADGILHSLDGSEGEGADGASLGRDEEADECLHRRRGDRRADEFSGRRAAFDRIAF